ncbi:MAG: hypothetical protein ABJD13_00170 [Paracoccaceae bacterium]
MNQNELDFVHTSKIDWKNFWGIRIVVSQGLTPLSWINKRLGASVDKTPY